MKQKFKLLIAVISLALLLTEGSSDTGPKITTNKAEYMTGELVTITISNSLPNSTLTIETKKDVYSFIGELTERLIFKPRSEGAHAIILKNRNNSWNTSFLVYNPSSQTAGASIDSYNKEFAVQARLETDKKSYSLGEFVKIRITGTAESVRIQGRTKSYDYHGSDETILFKPQETGSHTISARINRQELQEYFLVSGKEQEKTVEIKDSRNRTVKAAISSKADPWNADIEDIELTLQSAPVTKIEFKAINTSKGIALGIDSIEEPEKLDKSIKFDKAYAIDPSKLEFSSARVSAIATSNALFKCKEWDFAAAKCTGSWEKIMDLEPGKPYTFELTRDDPGFGEANITILNVQSYPQVGGTWVVMFNTTGKANLTITPVNDTYWNGMAGEDDLIFQDLTCAGEQVNWAWKGNSVFVEDYQCNATGFETSQVLTTGKHILEFRFGNDVKYAKNAAGDGYIIMLWDKTAIPAGWKCISCLPTDPFYNRFIMANSSYGKTGGLLRHNHTLTATQVGQPNMSLVAGGASGTEATAPTHTHSAGAGVSANSNSQPEYRNLKVIVSTQKIPKSLPAGIIGFFNATIPVGWQGYKSQNGLFIRGQNNTVTNTTGATHTHSVSMALAATTSTAGRVGGSAGDNAIAAHTHTATGTTSSGTNKPPYIELIMANLSAAGGFPKGLITMFNDTPTANWSIMSNTGGVLAGKFIVGNSTQYGRTGGSTFHNHTPGALQSAGSTGGKAKSSSGTSVAPDGHGHSVTVQYGNSLNLPRYATAIFAYLKVSMLPPTVTQNKPRPDYQNVTATSISIIFNCSITDDSKSKNISLYLTNRLNTNFKLNSSCTIPDVNGSCSWTWNLGQGNYTWNCRGYDSMGMVAWASNRTIKLAATAPPPTIKLDNPGNRTYRQSQVQFSYNVTAVDALDKCQLWANFTGTWKKNESQNPSVGQNYFTTISLADKSYKWNVFCNTTTKLEAFQKKNWTVNVHSRPPTINNPSVTPPTGQWKTLFNITATISDPLSIAEALAEITTPTGTKTNYTMTGPNAGGVFYKNYTAVPGGNYSVIIFAKDNVSNWNSTRSNPKRFNVTSTVTTNTYYTKRGGTVRINGTGFRPGSDITVNIYGSSTIAEYPQTAIPTADGIVYHDWAVPASNLLDPGNYSITLNDTTLKWLKGGKTAYVVVPPSTAHLWDDVFTGSNVLNQVNWSENNRQFINAKNTEDYIQANFTNVVQVGYTVSNVRAYVEHRELAASIQYRLTYWNGTAWERLCILPYRASDTMDSCNLTKVNTAAEINSLSIRFTDENTLGNNNDAEVDFIFIDFDIAESTEMTVTITDPASVTQEYNYTDTTHKAYKGINASAIPASIQKSTEATAEEYTNLTLSDNKRFSIRDSTNGYHVYQSFSFKVLQQVNEINSITLIHEGYATEKAPPSTTSDSYHLYLWNYSRNEYKMFTTATESATDQQTTFTLERDELNLGDFIDSAGDIWVLIEGDFTIGTGSNARAEIFTDYIELQTGQVPTLTGIHNVNATAVDADTVQNCWVHYRNTTYNSSAKGMLNVAANAWTNRSNSSKVSDGYYYVDVNCTDVPGTSKARESIYVKIDNKAPAISLNMPANAVNLSYNNITFKWNATDKNGGIIYCNLTLDGKVNNTLPIITTSGAFINTTANRTRDGLHYWNISCWDLADNKGKSQTWTFGVDTKKPKIQLNMPANDYWKSTGNISLNYTPQDNIYLRNCTLILNNKKNITNKTMTNGSLNIFKLWNLAQGRYNWSVNCTDFVGNRNSSATRTFAIDWTRPKLVRYAPLNRSNVSVGTVYFNISVEDNMDKGMRCNISIDNTIADKDFPVQNGTNATRPIEVSEDGWHNWSAKCWDNASNTNQTNMLWFFADGPPRVKLVKPANKAWNNTENITLWYNATDGLGIKNCTLILDGRRNATNKTAVINKGLSSFYATQLKLGYHNWSVNCTDISGYTANSSTRYFWVDYERPKVKLLAPANNSNYPKGAIRFNISVKDTVDTAMKCNISVDNIGRDIAFDVNNGTNASRPINIATEGWHNWSAKCWDNATNSNTTLVNWFYVDSYPKVMLEKPPNGRWNNTENITLWYNATDGLGIKNCTLILDGRKNATNQTAITSGILSYFNATQLKQGLHNWSVNCTDSTGNTNSSETRNFWIDWERPRLVLLQPKNLSTVAPGLQYFNFTTRDNLDTNMTCNITIDNTVRYKSIQASNGTNTSRTFTISQEGWHNWSVNCFDNATNINQSATLYFFVDGSPRISLISPSHGAWNSSENMTLWYNATDGLGIKNCTLTLDGSVYSNQSAVNNGLPSYFNATQLSEGTHTWRINCTDTSNLKGNSTVQTFTIDYSKPAITLLYPLGKTFINDTVRFNFTAKDNLNKNVTCNLSIDNAVADKQFNATNGTVTNRTVKSIAPGFHYWNVTCWDRAHNTNTSAKGNFTINTAPFVLLRAPDDGSGDTDGEIVFEYTAVDSSVMNCTLILNGKINMTNQTAVRTAGEFNNFTLTGLSQGEYNWTVNCTDPQGYVGTEYPGWTAYVDWIAPNITVHAPDDYRDIHEINITFNFTAYDNLDQSLTCNLTLNGTANQSLFEAPNGQPSAAYIANLSEGWWHWNITCWDHSGLRNETPTRRFYMNYSLSVNLISPPDRSGDRDGNLTLYYTAGDNSGVAWCDLKINGKVNQTNITIANDKTNYFKMKQLRQGEYNWSVNCTAMDLEEKFSGTRMFFVDLYPPQVMLQSPAKNQTINTSTALFNFTAIDSYSNETYCNLTLDATRRNNQPYLVLNGTYHNTTIGSLIDGIHFWNVTCWDRVNHTNTSKTRNFTVAEPPTVKLDSPPDNSWTGKQNITFYFNASDNTGLKDCTLYFNNKENGTTEELQNNAKNNITLNYVSEGIHNWSITCADDPARNEGSSETWTIKVDYRPPSVMLLFPKNNSWNNTAAARFKYTFFETNEDTCQLWGNFTGQWKKNQSDTSARPEEENEFELNLADGSYKWNIWCNDTVKNSAFNNTNHTLHIDTTKPKIVLMRPPNASWDNDGNIVFNFTLIEKNPDHCELWGNFTGQWKKNETLPSPSPNAFNWFGTVTVPDGFYKWNVWCNDSAKNSAWNNTNWTIGVDSHAPNLVLNKPENRSNASSRTVKFNFTTTDAMDKNMTCNLTIDNKVNMSRINATSGAYTIVTRTGMSVGYHNWSIICIDDAGNYNRSATIWFNITLPDLEITVTDIAFNGTAPKEGKNLTVNATVHNRKGIDANSIIVKFYERYAGGTYTQINQDKTIDVIGNSNTTTSVKWTSKVGNYEIKVAVDPANEFEETNENNNNASKNITTSLWTTVYGNTTGSLSIGDSQNYSMYKWVVTNATSSNIFAADSDSTISWVSLIALGRNTTGHAQNKDYEELDRALGAENLSDNINNTYFWNGAVNQLANFTVYSKSVTDVPVTNSTNSTEFITGILWDKSDLARKDYNGTQDIVFATKVAGTKQGAYALVDFEIRVPAYLRSYKKTTTDSVTFYAELK